MPAPLSSIAPPHAKKDHLINQSVADLVRERNALRRSVYNLTRASKQLEEMADLCSRLNWDDASTSMKLIRTAVFGHRYDDLALCALEVDAAFRHPNSVAAVLGYRVFADAIRRQLEEALRRKRAAAGVGGEREDGQDG